MDGSLVTFLATHADLITSTLHPPHGGSYRRAREERRERRTIIVGRTFFTAHHHHHHHQSIPGTKNPTARLPPSLPYRRSKAREERKQEVIRFSPALAIHSTPLSHSEVGGRKNLAPLRRPQERLCRSTIEQSTHSVVGRVVIYIGLLLLFS